jgi:DNA-binding CsgD family transcriptional regulator
MNVASRLTAHQIHQAYRLVGECRELGTDPHGWHRHLVERLRTLVDAQVGIGGNTRDLAPGKEPRSLNVFRGGWATPDAARTWEEYARRVPMTRTPEYARIISAPGPCGTFMRDHLWTRGAWYASQAFNDVHRPSGIDDYILSIAKAPGGIVSNSVWLHRPIGARPFTDREWRLVRFVHTEVGAMIGAALASALEPGLAGLSTRQRQTLDALLDGLSEKEIAARLGISTPTVHEYVGLIYRHFRVRARSELMARFVGRARPSRASGGTPLD